MTKSMHSLTLPAFRIPVFAAIALTMGATFSLSAQSAKVEELHDVPYLEEGRAETLDLYLPAVSSGKKRPGFVWIHGGGWAAGGKRDRREVSVSRALAGAGYVVISIDYALATSTRHTWDKAVQDCKNAVRFLRANAEKYNVDPRRIAVGGGSAGAHLALMVAYTAGQSEFEPEAPYPGVGSEVGAVIEMYGITNLLTRQKVDKQANLTGVLNNGSSVKFTGVTREEDAGLWRKASPVAHVRRDVPPTFITHGKRDTTVDYLQAVELADRLKAAGATYELVLLEKAGHTYDFSKWGSRPLEKDIEPLVLAFLDRHLGMK
jgi:acetyl esterase/lipase